MQMQKYKFKVGQEVYPVGTKRVFLEGSKHSQKWSGVVLSRVKDEQRDTNCYVIRTPVGITFNLEKNITGNKQKHLCYLLISDINEYQKLYEKPETIPEGSKLLSIMVIPND
jgi:hypothetical protein